METLKAGCDKRLLYISGAAAAAGLAYWYGKCQDRAAKLDNAIRAIDEVHRTQAQTTVLSELRYCEHVEEWSRVMLPGGVPSDALRLATRAQHLERYAIPRKSYPEGREGYLKWRSAVKKRQGQRISEILLRAGLDQALVLRVKLLVAKDLSLEDPEMALLENAACLTFLSHGLDEFGNGKDDAKMIDIFSKTWKKMSRSAHRLALQIDYSPRMLGLLVEAIAVAEVSDSGTAREVPELGEKTWEAVRDAFHNVDKEKCGTFGELFLEALEPNCRRTFCWPVCSAGNISKALRELIELHAKDAPRFESMIRSAAMLGQHFGGLTIDQVQSIKDSAVRVVSNRVPAAARPWEAFIYCVAAMLVPPLMGESRLTEFCSAVGRPLPTPGGGPAAAVSAAVGIALLEMSWGISAKKKGLGDSLSASFVELRGRALEAAGSDAHAYCGLLSSIYEDRTRPEGKHEKWMTCAADIPLELLGLCLEALQAACSLDQALLLKSVRGDWEAGIQHLSASIEISDHNISVNVKLLSSNGAGAIEARRALLKSKIEITLKQLA